MNANPFYNLPQSLRDRRQWVVWRYEERDGDKPTKVPYQARRPDSKAKPTDPATWASFEEAVAAAALDPTLSGIGYAVAVGENLVMVDCDGQIIDGQLGPVAQDVLALGTYVEVSPSGTGLHAFVEGVKPGTRCRKGPLEIYDRARFFTMTGNHVEGTPTVVMHNQDALDALCAKYLPSEPVKSATAAPKTSPPMPDNEIIRRASSAANGDKFKRLLIGDLSEYDGDQSKADLALVSMFAFWTQDEEQIDRLMRRSALGKREKWDRDDYRDRTIQKAIDGREEVYTGEATMVSEAATPASPQGGRRFKLTTAKDVVIRPIPWLWPGHIVRGAPSLFVGDPDSGKTSIGCDLTARVTTGAAWPDGLPGTVPRDVVFFTAEDSTEYGLVPKLVAAGADLGRVHFLEPENEYDPLMSLKSDLAQLDALLDEKPETVMLVVDPLSAYLPSVDTYKDNEVRSALGPFRALAHKRNIAVVAIIHLNKNTDRPAMYRILGSVAFVALARATFAALIDPLDATGTRRIFLCHKMNLGPKPAGYGYQIKATRVIDPGTLNEIDTARVVWESARVNMTVDEALRRTNKPRESDTAASVILEALADGPVAATAISDLVASRGLTVPARTLDRIKDRLHIGSVRSEDRWYWTLPGWTDDQKKAWAVAREAQATMGVPLDVPLSW